MDETPKSGSPRANLGATLALTIAGVLGIVLLLIPPIHAALPEVVLEPLLANQHQDAETALFALAFLVVLPASLLLAPRLADRIAAGPNGDRFGSVSALVSVGLLVALALVKVSERLPWGGGLGVLLAIVAAWAVAAGILLGLAARRPLPLPRATTIWAAGVALAAIALLSFAFLDSISIAVLAIALVVSAIALTAYDRSWVRGAQRPWGPIIDTIVVVLLLLAVTNVVIFRVGDPDPAAAFETSILHFHQDLFLGPASHVVGGGPILVDTFSQYGVGSIAFIAGWFDLVGVSNGMLGLLDGLLSACVFAAAYLVVRAVGVSRPLAVGGLLVAVLALAWGLVYPVGGLLQHGAIRFGMPMLVLVGAALEARGGRGKRAGVVIEVAAVGISSIWAFEGFAYTALTYVGVLVAVCALGPEDQLVRTAFRRLLAAVAACVGAHLAFAFATLIAAGELPEWGDYLSTLGEFLFGHVGDFNYDFGPWSPGLAVGALLLSSVAAFVLVLRRRPDLAEAERAKLILVAGSTAYGIALFTYLVNRSSDHIVAYVSLPAVIVVLLWLSIVLARANGVARPPRLVALGIALATGSLLIAVAWSGVGLRVSQSAIAHVIPGGRSLPDAIDRLHDTPPLSPGAPEAERLLEERMPGEKESLVLVDSDLGIEALARTGRINLLPLSNPWEDSLVPDQRIDELNASIDAVEAGTLALVSDRALEIAAETRGKPTVSLENWGEWSGTGLTPLQVYALQRLAERFRFRTVAAGGDGLAVIELEERGGS
ncbi:MAG: hypothetical protein U0R51_06590 [Solirubrobacterales bacterium]